MSTVFRIDVRKTQAEAAEVAALQRAKGFAAEVERAMVAIWNWSADGPTPDVVASDSDNEVFIVLTRAG